MAEMNPISRWFVNVGNARRSAQIVNALAGHWNPPPGARLLELGAGRGGLSALLQERYRPGRLVVTDFDSAQVEAARAFLSLRFGQLPPTIEVREVDARELPFEDRSFDAVFAINMLHHVETDFSVYEQRPGVLRQIRRVLAPSGSLVFKDFSRTVDLRRTLAELGFVPTFERPGWFGRYFGVFRAPS